MRDYCAIFGTSTVLDEEFRRMAEIAPALADLGVADRP
jgi:hypothetical protein